MNDDDIDAAFSALPSGASMAAPKVEKDDDIENTFAALRQPTTAPGHIKTFADLSKLPYAQKVIHYESHGDPNAQSSKSSAAGAGQFKNSTWLSTIKQHRPDLAAGKSDPELLSMRSDPKLSEDMVNAFGEDNAESLKASGIPVSDATKYGAHWFGADNFSKIYKADPKTPIEKIIGSDVAENNGLSGKTADEVKTLTAQRMGPDYMPQNLSWGDTLSQAGSNFLPSVGKMASGVYETVRHPLDTYDTLKKIGIGLDSKVEGLAGREQDPEKKKQDEALVDALGASYKEKYGSIDGFKQYLAHDPAGVLMDASTILSAGGGLAAKAPGIIGKAGELAATAGKLSNPLNPLGAVSGTVKAITRPTGAIDSAGNISAKTDALIKKVTNNGMSAADLVDPQIKSVFAATVGKKGLSEASVREGLMRSLGLNAPTSVVERTAPQLGAKEATDANIKSNNELLAERGVKLGGAPSTSNMGEALDISHTQSMNSASAAYDAIRNMPGSFGKVLPEMNGLGKLIRANFDKSGIPSADLTAVQRSGHTQTAAAIRLINDYWGKGQTLGGKGIDANEILSMRKSLNNFKSSATGSDIKGVGDVMDALDNHIGDLSKRGFFVDSSGRSAPNVGAQVLKANAGYRKHFATFETSNGSNNAVVNAVKKLKSGQGRDINGNITPSGDADLQTQAQGQLAKDLLNPTKGAATYNNLSKAIGSTTPIDQHVRSLLTNPETKNASDILNSPVGQKAFAGAPDDLAQARHIHAVHAINNAKPSLEERHASVLKGVAGSLAAKGVSTLAGYEALGPAGLVVGPMVEGIGSKIKEGLQAGAATAGAKPTRHWSIRAPGAVARAATNPTALSAEHYTDVANEQNRPAHARGGKVDIDSMVDCLMHRWKAVKRSSDRVTEPLLNADDNVIAKALHIAQEHI